MAWWDDLTSLFRRSASDVEGPQTPRRPRPGGPSAVSGFDTIRSVTERLRTESSRRAHYDDFEQMDREAPEAHRALDSFTDTAMQDGGTGEVFDFDYRAPGVREVIEVVNTRTGILDRAWGHIRGFRAKGDHFVELVFLPDGTLARVKDLPTREITREQDEFGLPDPYPWRQVQGSQFPGNEVAKFREWQVVQFGEVPAGQVYGYQRSQLAAARRPWKALEMAQASVLAERVLHTGTRLAFIVDVTGLSTDEALDYMREVRQDYQQTATHNVGDSQRSGQYDPLAPFDDLWIPWTQGGPQTPVDVLRFGAEIGEIADIKFLYGRFLSALEVPRYELGLDEDIRSKAATNVIDAGYLRLVMRAQTVYIRGLVKIYNRALFAAGFPAALLRDYRTLYSVSFAPLQLVDEKLRWEIAKLRAEVAAIYGLDLGIVGPEFLLRHFLGLGDEEIAVALEGAAFAAPTPSPAAERAELDRLPRGDSWSRLVGALGAEEALKAVERFAELLSIKAARASSDNLPNPDNGINRDGLPGGA